MPRPGGTEHLAAPRSHGGAQASSNAGGKLGAAAQPQTNEPPTRNRNRNRNRNRKPPPRPPFAMSGSANPHFFSQPFRYLRWASYHKPAYFYSCVVGGAGPVILLTVPPIRRYLGEEKRPRIPMTYPGTSAGRRAACAAIGRRGRVLTANSSQRTQAKADWIRRRVECLRRIGVETRENGKQLEEISGKPRSRQDDALSSRLQTCDGVLYKEEFHFVTAALE
jgi:hypothetical protein